MNNLVDWMEHSYIPCELAKSFRQWHGNLAQDSLLNINLTGYDHNNRLVRLLAQAISIYTTGNINGEKILKVTIRFPQMRSILKISDKDGKFTWTDPDTLTLDIVTYDQVYPGMVTTKCTFTLI